MSERKIVQKRKKGLETSRRILDAAAALFAHSGYGDVSMREIAEKVGIQESSLYNHFSGKAEILESLFEEFIRLAPESRPSDSDLERMLMIMEPEEIFKHILFHVGGNTRGTLANTVLIIHREGFRTERAAKVYYDCLVNEPAGYYERLINKMIERKMIAPLDARTLAEQYNYVSMALTQEYFMAQAGLADVQAVVGTMVRTLKFFCGLMKRKA